MSYCYSWWPSPFSSLPSPHQFARFSGLQLRWVTSPKTKNHRKNEAVEKKTGCLGYIGDYTTHLCGYKDPYETNSIMESKMIFFLVAQMMVNKIVITCYPPHLRCFVSFQLHRFANLKPFFTPKKEISFKVNDF